MRQSLILLLFVGLSNIVSGQEIELPQTGFTDRNSLQVELLGHGGIYSINYERVFINQHQFKTTGQIGIEYLVTVAVIPVIINQLISFNKHHIEIGLGFGCRLQYGSIPYADKNRWDTEDSFLQVE